MNLKLFRASADIWAIFGLVSSLTFVAAGCATPGKRTGIGAGAGAATGAAIGGLAGGWKGAGIGAAAGAIAGGTVGNYLDKQANELKEVAETRRVKDGILVKLKNDLLFDTGKSEVKDSAREQLTELGSILSKYSEDRIRVSGYTDNIGSSADNRSLAEARSHAVKEILLEQGVKDEQVRAIGVGEERPIASNATTKGRSQNRRVELLIDVPQDKSTKQTTLD